MSGRYLPKKPAAKKPPPPKPKEPTPPPPKEPTPPPPEPPKKDSDSDLSDWTSDSDLDEEEREELRKRRRKGPIQLGIDLSDLKNAFKEDADRRSEIRKGYDPEAFKREILLRQVKEKAEFENTPDEVGDHVCRGDQGGDEVLEALMGEWGEEINRKIELLKGNVTSDLSSCFLSRNIRFWLKLTLEKQRKS